MKILGFYFLAVLVLAAVIVLAMPIIALNTGRHIFRKDDLYKYIRSVVIGLDQVGGSILYGTKDWTISSYTWILHINGVKEATIFMNFIDWLIGLFSGKKNHCARAYRNEHSEHLKGGI